MSAKPNPFVLMDPEKSLRTYVGGTAATVPAWWLETDEDLACRTVARQLNKRITVEPCLVDQLWDRAT